MSHYDDLRDKEWPKEDRINAIGQNGNTGEHYVVVKATGGGEGIKAAALRRQIRENVDNVKEIEDYIKGIPDDPVEPFSGNKYKKVIKGTTVDIYDVTEAYETSHAIHHAVKKLLMAGQRGSKCYIQDLSEAIDSIEREIERQSDAS